MRFPVDRQWRFMFTDLQLAATTWAEGLLSNRQINFAGNQAEEISASVISDDFRVKGLMLDGYPRVAQSNRICWCFRREPQTFANNPTVYSGPWIPRAAGIVMAPQDEGDQDVALSHFTAYGPWKLLEARPVMIDEAGSLPLDEGFIMGGGGVTADEIALQVLKNTILNEGGVFIDAGPDWGGTDFYTGTIETCDEVIVTIQRGESVADTWTKLVEAHALDIILTPVYDPRRVITVGSTDYFCTHEISIRKSAGAVRPNALLCWDKLNRSVAKISRMHDGTPGSFFNKVQYYAGQGGPAVPLQENTASVDAFGSYWSQQFFPSMTSDDPLGSNVVFLAQQALVLAKQGKRTLTLDLISGRAPEPFVKYGVMDLVPIHASDRLRVTADGYFRVEAMPVSIDDNGVEQVSQLLVSPDFTPASSDAYWDVVT